MFLNPREIKCATKLDQDVKNKIAEYESQRWAADVSEAEIKDLWCDFRNELTGCLKKQIFTEKEMLVLTSYITTKDSLVLIESLDSMDSDVLKRFLVLIQWYADTQERNPYSDNAKQFIERVMVTYRMYMLPIVFSEKRLENAINYIKTTVQEKETQ